MWHLPHAIKLKGFAGYEKTTADSLHRNYTNGAAGDPNPFDGTTAPNEYNWMSEVDDDYWTYGLTLGMPVLADILAAVSQVHETLHREGSVRLVTYLKLEPRTDKMPTLAGKRL